MYSHAAVVMKHPPFLEDPESLRFERQRPSEFLERFFPLVGPDFTSGPWLYRGDFEPLFPPNITLSIDSVVKSARQP
jgi:hypothetical protein